ncbi:hypothetical protein VTH06DRAFT_1233 [Thermothelomyces fergusii]
MPLIIITGLPTSGKTTRARQLYDYLSARLASQSSSSSSSSSSPPPPHQPQQEQQKQPQSPPPKPSASPRPPYRLHLISDSTLSIPRTVYDLSPASLPAHVRSANAAEKDARAAVYGAVKRVLSPRDIVILDGLNYIKGWRYQLYCEAKNVRTGSCVLQVGAGVDRARRVNEARLARRRRALGEGALQQQQQPGQQQQQQQQQQQPPERQARQQQTDNVSVAPDAEKKDADLDAVDDDDDEEPYEPSNWENLVFRYEEPNAMNRWDSPLFTLIWDDDEAQARAVFDKIWDAIAGEGRKPVRPNQSTVQRDKDPGGDYLYVLERETQDIVKKILERQPDEGGGAVVLPRRASNAAAAAANREGEGEGDLVVELPGKKVGLPQLQRYRRAFVALNRGGIGLEAVGKLAAERLRESFVGYLNDAFEKDG